jgi:tetratricopeptide (TPR) repeat protein
MWSELLRSDVSSAEDYERLAQRVVEVYESGDARFREHIKNRSARVTESTGQSFDADNFDLAMARAFVADEIGFSSWDALSDEISDPTNRKYPILFHYAIAALWRGDFTALDQTIGGDDAFFEKIVDWYENGYLNAEPETMEEAFAAACWLGHVRSAEFLLNKGVDPYAGMRTGLSGFHWAASSGKLDVIKLLVERKVPMEVKSMYDSTPLGQALWSAINENSPDHAEIIETLVMNGAHVWPGTLEWWEEQEVQEKDTKEKVSRVLKGHSDFVERRKTADQAVATAERSGDKKQFADALKSLANILRRPPFGRDEANELYTRAAALYAELGLYLEEAWCKRHIGINHEYANRLEEAERFYDDALELYRKHSREDDLNYANAVRYVAVIKERLGKKQASAQLWEEAHERYNRIAGGTLVEGIAEAAAWLTILAIETKDLDRARQFFARAQDASARSTDPDTHKFIEDVRQRLENASIS